MNSIAYPKMFENTSTRLVEDLAATKQNLMLLLGSEEGDFKDDPDFGVALKRFTFEQNDYILKDLLIDKIYTKIALFMPQLTVQRKDIKITSERASIYISIKALNNLDFTTNMYNLVLTTEGE